MDELFIVYRLENDEIVGIFSEEGPMRQFVKLYRCPLRIHRQDMMDIASNFHRCNDRRGRHYRSDSDVCGEFVEID